MTELEFAERLKKLRKEKNLTQQELADQLGVSNKSVSRWETGGYPDVAMLGPLAKALGITVDDLLGETPPIRSLGRAEWQNLLSFAFAVGGGVLFFLLDLFTPTLICYLLYLGALAYGTYLQRYYTFHSRWFLAASAIMSLCINLQLLSPLAAWSVTGSWGSAAGMGGIISETLVSVPSFPRLFLRLLGQLFPWVLVSLAVTVVITVLVRRYLGDGALMLPYRVRLRKSAFSVDKALPALIPVLMAAFLALFLIDQPTETPVVPIWFYQNQSDLIFLLLGVSTVLAVLWLAVRKERRQMLPAQLLLSLGTILVPLGPCNTLRYNSKANIISQMLVFRDGDCSFLQPMGGVFLIAALLAAAYILCCFVKLEKK